jgi:hypothetical protein
LRVRSAETVFSNSAFPNAEFEENALHFKILICKTLHFDQYRVFFLSPNTLKSKYTASQKCSGIGEMQSFFLLPKGLLHIQLFTVF